MNGPIAFTLTLKKSSSSYIVVTYSQWKIARKEHRKYRKIIFIAYKKKNSLVISCCSCKVVKGIPTILEKKFSIDSLNEPSGIVNPVFMPDHEKMSSNQTLSSTDSFATVTECNLQIRIEK